MRNTAIYSALAQNFLSTKERTPYYEINYITDDCPAEGYRNLLALTEEERAKLLALRDRYGDDDFFNHLDEVVDEETFYDWAPGEVIAFDLDTPHYGYGFTCHQVTDKGVEPLEVTLELTDETYVRLLTAHLYDKHMNFNRLRFYDQELFAEISHNVDLCFYDDCGYFTLFPYAVTMDEVKADAAAIMSANPDQFAEEATMISYI